MNMNNAFPDCLNCFSESMEVKPQTDKAYTLSCILSHMLIPVPTFLHQL